MQGNRSLKQYRAIDCSLFALMLMVFETVIIRAATGYIQQVGTPYELYFKPANVFVAGFIGEPPMNFIRSRVENGCIAFGDQQVNLKELREDAAGLEGKEIVFGFRPEAAVLQAQENAARIDCQVELTEMLGDNTNVYITCGEAQAILKVDSHDTPETDAPLSFWIPRESVYLFDGTTEEVI